MGKERHIPFAYVLEELEALHPITGYMFGSHSIYVDDKIVLILRERDSSPEDNGVWIATTAEHHQSLREDLPSMRSIAMFGPGPTGWQVIPFESDEFDRDTLRLCALVRKRDPRIGKIPAKKRSKAKRATKKAVGSKKPSSLKKVAKKTIRKSGVKRVTKPKK